MVFYQDKMIIVQAILQNYDHENQLLNSGFLIGLSDIHIYVHIQHQSKKIVYYLFDSHAWDREGQISENGVSVLINLQKLEHLMEFSFQPTATNVNNMLTCLSLE